MEKLTVIIMPESVTGYKQQFIYDSVNKVCTERRCGYGRGCFTVIDKEYNFSAEAWENRIESFKKMVARLKNEAPEYTFEIEYVGE